MAHLMAQTMAYYPPQDMAYPCFQKSSLAKKILFSLPCFFKVFATAQIKKNFLQEIFATQNSPGMKNLKIIEWPAYKFLKFAI